MAGDAILGGLLRLVCMVVSPDEREATSGRGWFEAAGRASMATLVASHPAPRTAGPAGRAAVEAAPSAPAATWDGRGGIDDDEHLAAYNAFLARLNEAESGRQP